jgi:hypothetical protein
MNKKKEVFLLLLRRHVFYLFNLSHYNFNEYLFLIAINFYSINHVANKRTYYY